ncbi:MAG: YeeE/YedE thiosulfate transporter family protein [Paracoccaceae bacterium]
MAQNFVWGFAGGLVIGLAGAIFLLVNGRVMGASGIIGGLVDGSGRANASERLSFVAGLVGVPALAAATFLYRDPNVTTSWPTLIAAGLMVGVGTRLANGCTSGHGVCGISRLSLRGIVATFLYIGAGGVVMLALRHGLGAI